MGLRASRLRWPEWLIGAGGVVLLLGMLLFPWYTLTLTSGGPGPRSLVSQQVDGWHGLTIAHWLFLLTVLLALAAAFFQAQRRAPALPISLAVLSSVLGGVSALWLIVRFLIAPPGGRCIGGWIGLIGAAMIAYGGFESMRLEGIAREDAPTSVPTIDLAGQPTT